MLPFDLTMHMQEETDLLQRLSPSSPHGGQRNVHLYIALSLFSESPAADNIAHSV
jgi:hypothetical protein